MAVTLRICVTPPPQTDHLASSLPAQKYMDSTLDATLKRKSIYCLPDSVTKKMKLEPPPSAEDETILEYHAKKIRSEARSADKIEMEVDIRDFLNESMKDRVDKQGNIDLLQAELRAQQERANANLKATLNAALEAQEERANANLKATLNAALKAEAEIRHAEARAQEERADAKLKAQEERADAKLKAELKAALKAEAEIRQAALEAQEAKIRAETRAEALAKEQEFHRKRLGFYKGNLIIKFLDRIEPKNGKDEPKKVQNGDKFSSTRYIRQAEHLDLKTLKNATGLGSKFLKVIKSLETFVKDRNVAAHETEFDFAQYLVSVKGDGSELYPLWTPILLYAVQKSSLEEYIAEEINRGRPFS